MTLFVLDFAASLAAMGSFSGRAFHFMTTLPEVGVLGLLGLGLVVVAIIVRQRLKLAQLQTASK